MIASIGRGTLARGACGEALLYRLLETQEAASG